MNNLSELFFELSHVDRLGILSTLLESPSKLTTLGDKLGCSSQEVYRHLSRLIKAGLVLKKPGGDYAISSYGEQIMRLVPGYRFLNMHSEYFMTRDLTLLPDEFMQRIGELSGSRLVDDVMMSLFDVELMVKDAEEYIYIMIDQMIMNLYEPLILATERGVVFKEIRPVGWELPDEVVERLDKELLKMAAVKVQKGQVIQRELEDIPLFLALSEKTVSCLSFSDRDGEIDYLGFKSDDPCFHNWCRGLFEYYWASARPGQVRTNIPI